MSPRRAPKSGRDRILEVATTLFASHGYRATSMRMISKAARCDVALAYHHFGSKEALYEAIIRDYSSRYASLFAVVARPGTPEQRVGALVDAIIDFMRGNLPLVRTIMREAMAPTKVYTKTIQTNLRVLLEVAQGALERGAARNDVGRVEAREFLVLAYGMISYYMAASDSLARLFGEDPLEGAGLERLRREAKGMLLARLAPNPPG